MAPIVPVQPASMVFTAIVPMRRLPLAEAPSVLPGLNPNQPKARMKHPIRHAETSCPRMGLDEPARLYLPMRGLIYLHAARPVLPPSPSRRSSPAPLHYA